MSKHRKNDRDKDGYMVLIPKPSVQTTIQGDSTYTPDNASKAEYWRKRCEKLEKELKDAYDLMDMMRETIDGHTRFIDDLNELHRMELDEAKEFDRPGEPQTPDEEDSYQSEFDAGIGLSFGGGKDPKLYRLSDPQGPLAPKRKFAGARVEIQPGRGFGVKLRWEGQD